MSRTTALLLPFPGDQKTPLFAEWLLVLAVALGLLGMGTSKRKLRVGYALAFLFVACALWQAGCTGNAGSTRVIMPTGTPAGTYPVTVIGTSGSAQQTASVTLVVR
jgi:hypothetical protein